MTERTPWRLTKPSAQFDIANCDLKIGRGRHRKYLPYAFTEHGAIMAANVLNSPQTDPI